MKAFGGIAILGLLIVAGGFALHGIYSTPGDRAKTIPKKQQDAYEQYRKSLTAKGTWYKEPEPAPWEPKTLTRDPARPIPRYGGPTYKRPKADWATGLTHSRRCDQHVRDLGNSRTGRGQLRAVDNLIRDCPSVARKLDNSFRRKGYYR